MAARHLDENRRKAAAMAAIAATIPAIVSALSHVGGGGEGLFGLSRHFWSGFGIGLAIVLLAGSIVALRRSRRC